MTREHHPLLERVKQQLPTEPVAFQRLEERRESKARRKRATAGVVGLSVTAVLIGGLVWSTSRTNGGGDEVVTPGDSNVPLVAGAGEYYYVRLVWYSDLDQTPGLDDSAVGKLWIGPDDSGRVWSPEGEGTEDDRYAAGEFPAQFLPELSDDPDTMLQQLIQRGSEGGASPAVIATTSPGRSQETTSLLRTLQDLLVYGGDVFLTPQQTATVFVAATTIDEVPTEQGATDPLGRPATKLSFVIDYNIGPGSIVEWYFDPETGQFMGELWTNAASGEVQGAALVEMAGIAPSVDDQPEPGAQYVTLGSSEPSFLGSAGGTGIQATPSPEAVP